jgi:CheY-like chemotaxis protein
MKTVLIVDDEPAILETLASVLEDEGYRCLRAEDGKEGLAAVAQERPDLVISDVMMPGLDGREMLRAMRADPQIRDIPVIVMSAARGLPDIDRLDHDAFLPKPFDIDNMLETVARLVGGRAAR